MSEEKKLTEKELEKASGGAGFELSAKKAANRGQMYEQPQLDPNGRPEPNPVEEIKK
jgi:hypothetical protein